MSWNDEWFIAAVVAVFLITGTYQIVSRRRTLREVTQQLSIEEYGASLFRPKTWKWQGREVALQIASSRYTPRRAVVRVAAAAPSRVRIRSALATIVFVFGPPRLEPRWAKFGVEVWADDAGFVDRLFADAEIRTQIALAIRESGDTIDMDATQIRVAVQTSRHPTDAAAFFTAWHTASTVVERMQLGMTRWRLATIEIS